MSATPLRIQRRRTKGWRLPPNTVCVDRCTKWGNPFRICLPAGYDAAEAVRDYRHWVDRDDKPNRSFKFLFGGAPPKGHIIADLRGYNLACWCRLCPAHETGKPFSVECTDCQSCHADVLGRIANG